MNVKIKFDQEEDVFELVPAVKTLDQCMDVSDQAFEVKLKEAFDLAKSAGRELDVVFTCEMA